MAKRMTVHLYGKPVYDIVMETSFDALAKELSKLSVEGRKICVVTDSHVAELYLEAVKQEAAKVCAKVTSFVFPAGEENKNLNVVRDLYEKLILERFDRKDLLIALGGGVVGDLCGFAAATYLRGVAFVQIPTTLLSQVDSSIGGKTGVDFDSYKNMVGAFYMPKLVYENIFTLRTLPEEQFVSGMGEVIKHGLLADRAYYEWLKLHREEIVKLDLPLCQEMVRVSNEIKRNVVEEDPTEQGIRAYLNLGHTLGHAIEKLKNFSLLHGQCVGLGCIAAAFLSAERGWISLEEAEDIKETMRAFQIPTEVEGLRATEVIEASRHDKKMDAGVIRFVLLRELGQACVDKTVTEEELRRALEKIGVRD
ncbi:MAG: 3-dehydroquinate synthase [bacterium]|nr:3-dehydroquinate synthase [bacterium]